MRLFQVLASLCSLLCALRRIGENQKEKTKRAERIQQIHKGKPDVRDSAIRSKPDQQQIQFEKHYYSRSLRSQMRHEKQGRKK